MTWCVGPRQPECAGTGLGRGDPVKWAARERGSGCQVGCSNAHAPGGGAFGRQVGPAERKEYRISLFIFQ
jgi:hypothetical protein